MAEEESISNRRSVTIQVATSAFLGRINDALREQVAVGTVNKASVYSRLALIHRVAKAYACEEVSGEQNSHPEVEIDELTDPPLMDEGTENEWVVITFSYIG